MSLGEQEQDRLELILNSFTENTDHSALTKWEADFMADQVERFKQWGSRMRISEKQWEVLDRVYDKLNEGM